MLDDMRMLDVDQTTWVPNVRKLSDHAVKILAPRKFSRRRFGKGLKITRVR